MRQRGLLPRHWPILLVAVLFGCGPSSPRRLTGHLLLTPGSNSLNYRDLSSNDERTVAEWDGGTGPLTIGGLVGEEAVISREREGGGWEILGVNVRGGEARMICRGAYPVVMHDGGDLLYYADQPPFDTLIALCRLRRPWNGRPDTLGLTRTRRAKPGPWWWVFASAPVELDNHSVAVLGPDSTLWRVDVRSGRWTHLWNESLIPEMWNPIGGTLICWTGPNSDDHVELDLLTHTKRTLRPLRSMTGYAQRESTGKCLIVVPGRPLLLRDSWELKLYDYQRRKAISLGRQMHFGGRALWLR
jgi:hypothetical protein